MRRSRRLSEPSLVADPGRDDVFVARALRPSRVHPVDGPLEVLVVDPSAPGEFSAQGEAAGLGLSHADPVGASSPGGLPTGTGVCSVNRSSRPATQDTLGPGAPGSLEVP